MFSSWVRAWVPVPIMPTPTRLVAFMISSLVWLNRRPELADLATGFILALGAYLGTGVFLHLSYERYYWILIALAAATESGFPLKVPTWS
mgnify:CR=1 FL=1